MVVASRLAFVLVIEAMCRSTWIMNRMAFSDLELILVGSARPSG
jgi:hypothetical protein